MSGSPGHDRGLSAPQELDAGERAEQWALVTTPLGRPWSGRARYAAAVWFHARGEMDSDTLEVYRICARLDFEDPVSVMRERGVGGGWIAALQAGRG